MAAPFCRPKLQAVVQRSVGEGKSHAEWLKELRDYVDNEEDADGDEELVIEHITANGNDPRHLPAEPDEPKNGEDVPNQTGPVRHRRSG